MCGEISVGERTGKTEVIACLCMFINNHILANGKPRSFAKILIALCSFFQALRVAAQIMKLKKWEPVLMVSYQ